MIPFKNFQIDYTTTPKFIAAIVKLGLNFKKKAPEPENIVRHHEQDDVTHLDTLTNYRGNAQVLKPLNKSVVRSAAQRLMERNYAATTAEVKQLLRAHNYWAVHSSVHRLLEELAEEEDWYRASYNFCRNYFKNEVTANYFLGMSAEERSFYLENVKVTLD
ncbi:MAG: hypothetical protein AAF960_28845 [Bacteroidota bacterium]